MQTPRSRWEGRSSRLAGCRTGCPPLSYRPSRRCGPTAAARGCPGCEGYRPPASPPGGEESQGGGRGSGQAGRGVMCGCRAIKGLWTQCPSFPGLPDSACNAAMAFGRSESGKNVTTQRALPPFTLAGVPRMHPDTNCTPGSSAPRAAQAVNSRDFGRAPHVFGSAGAGPARDPALYGQQPKQPRAAERSGVSGEVPLAAPNVPWASQEPGQRGIRRPRAATAGRALLPCRRRRRGRQATAAPAALLPAG